MSVLQIVNGLKSSVVAGQNPFVTYKEFARAAGLSEDFPLAWANRTNLDEAAQRLKNDPLIGLDLTFLMRSSKRKYPSIIDGKRYDPKDPKMKLRARSVASQIISKFGLKVPNPY